MARPLLLFERKPIEVIGVRQGFSWPAFFFGSLWAIVKRAWRLVAAMLALDIVLWFGSGYAAQAHDALLLLLFLVLDLAYAIVRGLYGNRWLVSSLLGRGYSLVGGKPGG